MGKGENNEEPKQHDGRRFTTISRFKYYAQFYLMFSVVH